MNISISLSNRALTRHDQANKLNTTITTTITINSITSTNNNNNNNLQNLIQQQLECKSTNTPPCEHAKVSFLLMSTTCICRCLCDFEDLPYQAAYKAQQYLVDYAGDKRGGDECDCHRRGVVLLRFNATNV